MPGTPTYADVGGNSAAGLSISADLRRSKVLS